jgi:hypothetical protein
MPNVRTPRGITPPAPGLDREEPTFVPEQDLPDGQRREAPRGDRAAARDDRPARSPERE